MNIHVKGAGTAHCHLGSSAGAFRSRWSAAPSTSLLSLGGGGMLAQPRSIEEEEEMSINQKREEEGG